MINTNGQALFITKEFQMEAFSGFLGDFHCLASELGTHFSEGN